MNTETYILKLIQYCGEEICLRVDSNGCLNSILVDGVNMAYIYAASTYLIDKHKISPALANTMVYHWVAQSASPEPQEVA